METFWTYSTITTKYTSWWINEVLFQITREDKKIPMNIWSNATNFHRQRYRTSSSDKSSHCVTCWAVHINKRPRRSKNFSTREKCVERLFKRCMLCLRQVNRNRKSKMQRRRKKMFFHTVMLMFTIPNKMLQREEPSCL